MLQHVSIPLSAVCRLPAEAPLRPAAETSSLATEEVPNRGSEFSVFFGGRGVADQVNTLKALVSGDFTSLCLYASDMWGYSPSLNQCGRLQYVESVESLRSSCDPSENGIVLLIENEQ